MFTREVFAESEGRLVCHIFSFATSFLLRKDLIE